MHGFAASFVATAFAARQVGGTGQRDRRRPQPCSSRASNPQCCRHRMTRPAEAYPGKSSAFPAAAGLFRPHLARGGPQCVRDQGSADPFVNSVASPSAKLPTLESITRRNCKAVHAFCWSCVSLVGILKMEPAKSEPVYTSTVLLASKQQAAECGLHRSRRGSAASRPPYSGWLTALTTNGALGLEMVIWRVEVPSSWRFLPTTTRVKVSVPEKSGLAK